MEANPSSNPILIKFTGPVPSFKTGKRGTMVRDPRTGGWFARPITKREHRQRMAEITRAIESALRSAWRAHNALTWTECSLPSWIASFWPADDSPKWIGQASVTVHLNHEEPGVEVMVSKL